MATHAIDGKGLPPPPEYQAPGLSDPQYAAWRGGLEAWRERSAQRESSAKQKESAYARLGRLRAEAAERKEVDERRRQEAAERAEQRRQEAAEYSAWRADVVLAKKAEERDRAREHGEWRDRIAKLRRGVVAPLASLVEPTVTTRLAAPEAPGHGVSQTVPRSLPSSPGRPAERDLEASAALPGVVDDVLDEAARQQLTEDEAWQAAVAKNREALLAERAKRKEEAARREHDEYLARVLGPDHRLPRGGIGFGHLHAATPRGGRPLISSVARQVLSERLGP